MSQHNVHVQQRMYLNIVTKLWDIPVSKSKSMLQ